MNYLKERLNLFAQYMTQVDANDLERLSRLIWERSQKGSKIIVAGNGGSAAIASHVSVDLTKFAGARAINFNEANLITCLANDYGYERWLEKAIEFYAGKNDVVILISSSGESMNIVNGARKAKKMGLSVITFSGFLSDNKLKKLGEINFWVNSKQYNVVEIVHLSWLLAVVDRVYELQSETK